MRDLFGSWKYIFKNLWFVLPFAIVPAIFLALSLDYTSIAAFTRGFFTGDPRFGFVECFRIWSFIRIDSWLGGLYSVLAFLCVVFFSAFMLAFVEKHMRIGRRTFSGVYPAFLNVLFSSFLITLFYTALYEVWVVVLSAVLFVVSAFKTTALVYVFSVIVFLLFTYALLFLVTLAYLWLPCRQMTGFGAYDALIYSYRLAVGERWSLILSYLVSYIGALFALGGASFLSALAFRAVAIVVYILLFLSFLIRMEVTYFKADKLDREDILHTYKEY